MSLLQGAARRGAGLLGRESWLVRRLRPAYESLLDWSSNGQGIPWSINGVEYRVDAGYRHYLGQNYDAPVAAFLRERVRRGAVCLDVGANVGVYVLQFAHWSGLGGHVHAFEPNPAARSILHRHILINDLKERVTVVPTAIGASNGEAVLYAAGADGMSRMGAPNSAIADEVQPLTVPLMTLDHYCQRERLSPDWLMIDIEGFEIAALEGARRLIESRGRSLGIIVEMHPNVWASAQTSRARAKALLADLRLKAIPLTGQSDPLHDYGLVHLEHE
ncbi:MAG TPA: FkbM family methyltransferase [Pyrinomonadaceae bacterium]|jgi:FkbM family methyltransferase|nr:FkbM family methyltransferase [Pyrinomonadaceae bacterium]